MRSNREQKKNLRRGIYLVVILLIVIAPSLLTSRYGYGFSPILTGSMRPAAQPGDVYITRLTAAKSLHVGDVIAVNNQVSGTYYSHRIVEIREVNNVLRFTTQGDANPSPDRDPVMFSPSGQISLVVGRVPWVGRPMVYMNTVQGRQAATSFLVVANILALFAFLFRKKITANFGAEKIYRELYQEQYRANLQYREVIDQLQESLAVAQEENQVRSGL